MAEITLLRMGDNLIAPIQVELHDSAALKFQETILGEIERNSTSGLIVDVSALAIVDSFLGRLLGETVRMARIMGVESVLVGLRKEVVITLVQLGFVARDLHVALNMDEGLALLSRLKSGQLHSKVTP